MKYKDVDSGTMFHGGIGPRESGILEGAKEGFHRFGGEQNSVYDSNLSEKDSVFQMLKSRRSLPSAPLDRVMAGSFVQG